MSSEIDYSTFLTDDQPQNSGFDYSTMLEDSIGTKVGKAVQRVGDVAISGAKGVIGWPQSIAGLADIPTGGKAGKALEESGVRFKDAQNILSGLQSPEQQAANTEVANADGFVDTTKAALRNPSVIAGSVAESLPSMGGGAAMARLGLSGIRAISQEAAKKAIPIMAGLGEGAVTAGQTAEQVRAENENKLLTAKQTLAAVASGTITGGIGAAAARLVNTKFGRMLGLHDMDVIMAQGGPDAITAEAAKTGFIKSLLSSGFSEGVLEELPQSAQEQMWQNYAQNKPVMEGVGNAAATGMLAGAAMGGAGGGYNAMQKPQDATENGVNSDQQQIPMLPAPQTSQESQVVQSGQQFTPVDLSGTGGPIQPPQDPTAEGILNRLAELEIKASSTPEGLSPQEQAEYQSLQQSFRQYETDFQQQPENINGQESTQQQETIQDGQTGQGRQSELLNQSQPAEVPAQSLEETNAGNPTNTNENGIDSGLDQSINGASTATGTVATGEQVVTGAGESVPQALPIPTAGETLNANNPEGSTGGALQGAAGEDSGVGAGTVGLAESVSQQPGYGVAGGTDGNVARVPESVDQSGDSVNRGTLSSEQQASQVESVLPDTGNDQVRNETETGRGKGLSGLSDSQKERIKEIEDKVDQLTTGFETRMPSIQASIRRDVDLLEAERKSILESSKPKPNKRFKVLDDSRIKDRAEYLRGMRAGWSTKGGELLRDTEGTVSGRTTWMPHQDWFSEIPSNARMSENDTQAAVEKAIAGEPMSAQERRSVIAMLDWLDGNDEAMLREQGIDPEEAKAEAQAEREAINKVDEFPADEFEDLFHSVVQHDNVRGLSDEQQRQIEDWIFGESSRSDESSKQASASETVQDSGGRGEETRTSGKSKRQNESSGRQSKRGSDNGNEQSDQGNEKAGSGLGQGDLFTSSDKEQSDLKAKQDVANIASAKDKKRNGDGADPAPLFSDNPAMAGQMDLADFASREEEKQTASLIQKILKLFGIAVENKSGNKNFVDLDTVTDDLAAKILEKTGVNVAGFTHSIDESSIRHALKEHGNESSEIARGQLPVTQADFEKYPDIVNNPDSIEKGKHHDSIILSKKIGDEIFVVQEIRKGRKKLSLVTMWKKPLSAHGDETSPAVTPETDGKQASSVENKIPQVTESSTKEKIDDLGEKVGGARKDTATKTGKSTVKKEKDERPAWARRFQVSQIVAGREAGKWSLLDTKTKSWGGYRTIGVFNSEQEAQDAIPLAAVSLKHNVYHDGSDANGNDLYAIWRTVGDRKRVKIVAKQFSSRDEAMRYMAEHAQEIIETNSTFGEADLPVPANKQRIGEARRKGNVVGQDFMDAFGFRGVEFGNWNNQDERQEVMNEAYDGLLDLAEVMDIPPKAIGLNGDLALAFGARGQGLSGARAHYETDKAVINLTKMNGAGALAHEWFHALDHYFARQDGKSSSEWKIDKDGTRSLKVTGNEFVSHGFKYNSKVRPELRDAYNNVMETMFYKAEKYVEDTQKADKFVGRAREDLTNSLAKLRNHLSSQLDPRYYKRNNKPATTEQLAEFDTIANMLISGEGLELDVRYIGESKRRGMLAPSRLTNDALEKLSEINKAVRGRSGFDSTNRSGVLDSLRGDISRYLQRLNMLAEATDKTEKTKKVLTSFAMDAKELDQGRGENYWTTPHEMAARAFQGYVEDKISEKGGRSPFLNYGPANAFIETPWGLSRPFPHGEERQAINASFDNFITVLEKKETNSGVALFSRGNSENQNSDTNLDAIKSMANQIAETHKGLPAVHVLQSTNEAPAELKAEMKRQGHFDTAEGAWHNGEIYLFADNLSSVERAEFVLAQHEATHVGLRGILGDSVTKEMNKLYRDNAVLRKKATAYQKSSPVSNAVAVEEVLADMTPEDLAGLKGWKSIVAKIAEWFKSKGFDRVANMLGKDQVDSDKYAAELVKRARQFVKDGREKSLTEQIYDELREQDEIFKHKHSEKTSLKEIIGEVASLITYKEETDFGNGYKKTEVILPNKMPAYIFEDVNEVWVDVQHSGYGQKTGALYAAVGNYAFNTRKVFIDDPAGVSRDAVIRRPVHMQSLAIKYGTTKFLGKSKNFDVESKSYGLPVLDWTGGDEDKINSLLRHNIRSVYRAIPELRAYRYDFEQHKFTTRSGRPLKSDFAEQLARSGSARSDRIGESTIRRAIFFESIASATSSEKSRILENYRANGRMASASERHVRGLLSRGQQPNALQKIRSKAEELTSPQFINKIIYELQDKYIDLKNLRSTIQKLGGTITDLNDAYNGEILYHGRVAKQTKDFLSDELKPLLAGMRAAGISVEEMESYLHARHAPEANAEMSKRNPSQAMIDFGRQQATDAVQQLQVQLASARKNNSSTKALENDLKKALEDQHTWNTAQAFKGTEDERLSLSGMSNAEADAIMNGFPAAKKIQLDRLAKDVDAIQEKTLNHLVATGLMDRDSIDRWRATYQHYIPLHRDEAHPDSVSHPIGQGFSTRGDASRQRVGSNSKVTNILGHIAMQRESAITRGEKNNVMKQLYLMARQNPLTDYWTLEIPKQSYIDSETGFVRHGIDPNYKQRENVALARIAGKDTAIIFNKHNPEAMRLARAIKNLDVDDLHYIIPFVGKATRWLAAVNTQYNPIFGIINLMRDFQSGLINLESTQLAGMQGQIAGNTKSILKDVIANKGRMPKSGQWASLYKEFESVGGTTGYRDLFLTPEDRGKALLDELDAMDQGSIAKAGHAIAGWLSDYNEAMENSVRLSTYKAAIDTGMSKQKAAVLAKNLTVNFNKKGRQARELGALYAFFNASVQGSARILETLKSPAGKKIIAGGVAIGMIQALIGPAIMGGDGDDDNWKRIPDFIKERSFIIPLSHEDYLMIPMPLGFHFLPNIGRIAVETMADGGKDLGKNMLALSGVLADAFNPLGGSSSLPQMMSPSVMDPVVSLMENKDWTGKPIYREDFNSLDPTPGFKRVRSTATPWSKGTAYVINALTGGTDYTPGLMSPTPDQIDYVIGQITGGLGREASKFADVADSMVNNDELPAYKIPLFGRLYGNVRGQAGQSDQFYKNILESNTVENEIKGRIKDGMSPAEYLRDNPNALNIMAAGNRADKVVKAMRERRAALTAAGAPAESIKAVNEQITEQMKIFNNQMNKFND